MMSRTDGEDDGLVNYHKPQLNPVLKPPQQVVQQQRQSPLKETLSQMLQFNSKKSEFDAGKESGRKSALIHPSNIVTNFKPITPVQFTNNA